MRNDEKESTMRNLDFLVKRLKLAMHRILRGLQYLYSHREPENHI